MIKTLITCPRKCHEPLLIKCMDFITATKLPRILCILTVKLIKDKAPSLLNAALKKKTNHDENTPTFGFTVIGAEGLEDSFGHGLVDQKIFG